MQYTINYAIVNKLHMKGRPINPNNTHL